MAQKPVARSAARGSGPEDLWPVAWPGAEAARIWLEIGTEGCDFVVDRVRSDLETQKALLHCTGPVDAQIVLMRHGLQAIEDYYREAGRMMQLLHRVPGAAAILDS